MSSRRKGLTRDDLGREAFVERVWAWLEKYGGMIMGQLRSLGASLDYRRERMTMDEEYVRAVMRFFIHLYEQGARSTARTESSNWCPRDASAISDLEVNHIAVDDTLSWIRYPLADGSGHVTIATVRPATMLADTGVAVNPNDERYTQLIGKEAIVPIVERRVPIIADERVEMDFGTGALKITPGHDPVDFEIGRDHGLEEITVIGLDGRMNEDAGEFAGLTQEEANERDRRAARGAGAAREAGAVPSLGRALRPLRHAHRAADHAPVVGEHEAARGAGRRRRSATDGCASHPSSRTTSRSTGSTTSATGASRARSGGDTGSRSGTARTAT